jgi:hypothetical protein
MVQRNNNQPQLEFRHWWFCLVQPYHPNFFSMPGLFGSSAITTPSIAATAAVQRDSTPYPTKNLAKEIEKSDKNENNND